MEFLNHICEGPRRPIPRFGQLDLMVKMAENTVQEMVASYKNIYIYLFYTVTLRY